MKAELTSLMNVINNPKWTEGKRMNKALQAAFAILNEAGYDIMIEEEGSMAVYSSQGDIVLCRKTYLRFKEYRDDEEFLD
jgi:hypothetical protein